MKYCPKCGTKLADKALFCDNCGNKVVDNNEKLQQKVDKLQMKLKDQKQNNSINILSRLAFTRKHMIQVFNFMKDNALTLFFITILMIFPWNNHLFRVFIFFIYLIVIYTYPLLTNQKRFTWDRKLEIWINDKNNIKQLRENTQDILKEAKNEIKKRTTNAEQKSVLNEEKPSEINNDKSNMSPKTQVIKNDQSILNAEFMLGVLMDICGSFMYFSGKIPIGSLTQQLTSIIRTGTLDSSGYLYIWGIVVLGIGILATIGGLTKMLIHNVQGGNLAKWFAIIIAIITGFVATVIYSDPMSIISETIQGGFDFENIKIFLNVMKCIPWIVTLIYVIGIFFNIGNTNRNKD